MADQWDDEDFEPTTVKVSTDKWEGEDEEDDVRDSWDADEEQDASKKENVEAPTTQAAAKKKRRKLEEIIAEKEAKKADEFRKRQEEMKLNEKSEDTRDQLQKKMDEIRLQEEADLELAKEAFGDSSTISSPSHLLSSKLESKDDFDMFRKLIADRISPSTVSLSPHFIPFVEDVLRDVVSVIGDIDDLKKISGVLSALYNEKLKASKSSKGKKSKKVTAGKFSAKGGKQEELEDYGDIQGDDYDDFM